MTRTDLSTTFPDTDISQWDPAPDLLASVPAGDRGAAAAIRLLAGLYNGRLLAMPRVQACLRRDGDRVQVHWPSLVREADRWQDYPLASDTYREAGIPSPVAHWVVRLAELLDNHEFLDDELHAFAAAFAAAADDTGPALAGPTLEQARAFMVEFPDWQTRTLTAPMVRDALDVEGLVAVRLVAYFDALRVEQAMQATTAPTD